MTEQTLPEFETGSDFREPQPSGVQNQPALRLGEVPVFVFEDPTTLGNELATNIVALLEARKGGGRFLLGCPGGRSLRTTYTALAHLIHRSDVDLSDLVIVMMDEYLDQGPSGLVHCPSDAHYSCTLFAQTEIRGLLNNGLPATRQIPRSNIWVPDPTEPEAFDQKIAEAGGVDIFLVAAGSSDGHVAFNPPGTPLDSTTSVVKLADSTRRDNMVTFPAFADLDEVPRFGVSVGLGTIKDRSRRVALVMTGPDKARAVGELERRLEFQPAWPATMIFECDQPAIYMDRAAAIGFDGDVVNAELDSQGTVRSP